MEDNKDLGGVAVRGEAVADIAEVDKHLDAVLRASGSALHYFSMQKVIGDMRNAMIEAMRSGVVQVSARAADAPSDLPTEILAKVMTRDDFNCSTELGYAQFLAWAIWLKSYRNVSPDFSIMDNLKGVLSQIDNMVCGLSRAADALDSQPTELPPLPESDWTLAGSANNRDAYTADQMREYGRQCASSQPTDGGVRNG